MGYFKQDEVKRTVNKLKKGKTVDSDHDCIPMITDDIAKILLACNDSYAIIEDDEGNEYEINKITTGYHVTGIYIKRVVFDEDRRAN